MIIDDSGKRATQNKENTWKCAWLDASTIPSKGAYTVSVKVSSYLHVQCSESVC